MYIRRLFPFVAVMALVGCQATKMEDLLAKNDLSEQEVSEKISESGERDEPQVDSVTTTSIDNSVSTSKETSRDYVSKYVPPRPGTVFTWRNNWANLPEIISYRVAGTVNAGDSEYLKFTSVKGFKSTTHAYYNAKDYSLKGYRDRKDKAIVTYKPVEQRYKFPMAPGDKWLTQWKSLDHKTDRITVGGGVVHAIRMETLNLPFGKIRAMKVKMPVQKSAPKGITHYAWFSPELGVTVKEEIGGGILNWSQVLERVEFPE
ncbi:MAG: hypothetical protein ACR2O3_01680 [Rhizobiaceae bacterium]